MPQLDFANPLLIAQVVWLLIIFGGLYLLLAGRVLPAVGEVLENRANRIASDLEAAHAAKAEADAAMAELRAATAQARSEAQATIATALEAYTNEAQERADMLSAKLAEQISAAEARIDAARNAAMGALRGVAADTATALVTKLVGSADAAAVDAAVGQALAARGNA
ncbi:MAG: F0F1 ATP synthase subunit B' [Alphaproteobacteria bacterium]|nr:F0F1 ATP synthase subunit B' [Alphaproteobacteria bacterium]